MRVLALFLVVIVSMLQPFAAAPAASTNSLDGHWRGAVSRDGAVQLIDVRFQHDGDSLSGTYDVPELGLYGEPLIELTLEDSSLKFRFYFGRAECLLSTEPAEITGQMANWNPLLTLNLKPALEPPMGFTTEDVTFSSAAAKLAGTVYRPVGPGPFPAVIFAHPSGEMTRLAWTDRAHYYQLASRGILCLYYDKRGCGQSSGDLESATPLDLAADLMAGFEFLQNYPDVDAEVVGIFGGSQGGWLAAVAAAEQPDVAFVILRSGPARTVWEQELDRVEFVMREEGAEPEDIAAAVDYTRRVFAVAASGEGLAELLAATEAAQDAPWANYAQLIESADDLEGWRSWNFDPAPYLRRVRCPVYAMFGELDPYVPPERNVPLLEQYLRDAGNERLNVIVFQGAGHSLDLYKGLPAGEWKWPESYWVFERKPAGMYDEMVDWVLSVGEPSEFEHAR